MKSTLTVIRLLAAIFTISITAHGQIDLTAKVKSDQQIILVSNDNQQISLDSIEISKTKEITIPFSVKRTGYFSIPESITQFSPTKILFGKNDPEKGWGLRLVRFTPKADRTVEVIMKMGALSMKPAKEFHPYNEEIKLPEAVKNADGEYSLVLPKELSPGYYAVVGFNGGSGVTFSKKNGVVWVFEVPKIVNQ